MIKRKKINQKIIDRLMWNADVICNYCQKERNHLEIHHIDNDKNNNKYDNLILVCRNCHSIISSQDLGRKKSESLILKYKYFWEGIVKSRREELKTLKNIPERKKDELKLTELVSNFYKFFKERNASNLFSLFTPPRNDSERSWLEDYILGGDLGPPGNFVRLFTTRAFCYSIEEYDILKITTLDSKNVAVIVEEWTTSLLSAEDYPNDDTINMIFIPHSKKIIFKLKKINTKWYIDRYELYRNKEYSHKYGGFGG